MDKKQIEEIMEYYDISYERALELHIMPTWKLVPELNILNREMALKNHNQTGSEKEK